MFLFFTVSVSHAVLGVGARCSSVAGAKTRISPLREQTTGNPSDQSIEVAKLYLLVAVSCVWVAPTWRSTVGDCECGAATW